MNGGKNSRMGKTAFNRILCRAVCVLIVFASLTAWSVGGLYAKFVDSADVDNSATVANMGVIQFDLKEHEAKTRNNNLNMDGVFANDMVYYLDTNSVVNGNTYSYVMPGVNIPKDPYVSLNIKNAEVNYELYIEVTEKNLPEEVTYVFTDNWQKTNENRTDKDGNTVTVYKYNTVFLAGVDYDHTSVADNKVIKILQNDELKVSSKYVGFNDKNESKTFALVFAAYLKQSIL